MTAAGRLALAPERPYLMELPAVPPVCVKAPAAMLLGSTTDVVVRLDKRMMLPATLPGAPGAALVSMVPTEIAVAAAELPAVINTEPPLEDTLPEPLTAFAEMSPMETVLVAETPTDPAVPSTAPASVTTVPAPPPKMTLPPRPVEPMLTSRVLPPLEPMVLMLATLMLPLVAVPEV